MELKINKKTFAVFSEATKALNKIQIIPILYGSLGLFKLIGEEKKVEDADVLVPKEMLNERWEELVGLMEKLKFKLIDEKEHEFEKDGEIVAFGDENDLQELVQIDLEKIKIVEENGVKFKELSAEQYLDVYESLSRDKYRQDKKGKNDQEKIDMLKNFLGKNKISQEQEYLEGWKRCQADFDNFKKRQSEQQIEMIKYANQNLILDIIPVIDNFHASTDHIPEDQKENPWVTGIMYIQKQLEKVLADNSVSEIETKVGDKFNPAVHEAVHNSEQETVNSEQLKHKVKKIVLKGYKIGDKIIRAARVIVE